MCDSKQKYKYKLSNSCFKDNWEHLWNWIIEIIMTSLSILWMAEFRVLYLNNPSSNFSAAPIICNP